MRGGSSEPPFAFTAPSVAASFLCVRPTKLGIIGLGTVGGVRQCAINDAPPRSADVRRETLAGGWGVL